MQKEKQKKYIRWAVLAAVVLLTALLQNTRGGLPSIFGVNATPLIPLVVCIGMFERDLAGAFFGLFAGALWDIAASRGDGFHAIFLLIAGCVCGLLISHIMRNNFVTSLVLTAAALLLHNLLFWLFFYVFAGVEGAGRYLVRWLLPSTLYTLLFLPLFYFAIRWLIKKLRRPSDASD